MVLVVVSSVYCANQQGTLRPVKRPKLRLWLSPLLPQMRLGKKIFHAKIWASEIVGTFVRVRLEFVLNKHWNQYFYHANFYSAIGFYGNFMVTLTKVPAVPEAWNFAWDVFLPSLNHGKIGESQRRSLGRFMGRNKQSIWCSCFSIQASQNTCFLRWFYFTLQLYTNTLTGW